MNDLHSYKRVLYVRVLCIVISLTLISSSDKNSLSARRSIG